MTSQHVATNEGGRTEQIFYRWNLAPSTTAMWQLAMQHVGRSIEVQTNWIDLGCDWSWLGKHDEQGNREFARMVASSPPAAIVLGIDRTNLAQVAAHVFELYERCKRWTTASEQALNTSLRDTFILGWFPQADREAVRILRELGVDLVLHDPASLRPALAKIVRFGYSSQK